MPLLIARVLAIPTKRCDKALVDYLTDPEADAVTASPTAALDRPARPRAARRRPPDRAARVRNSPGYATRTLSYGLALTCAAGAKAKAAKHTAPTGNSRCAAHLD